jgi:hypothetical protein
MLQERGARFDTLAVRTLASQWKAASPLGGEFTMLSFTTPGKAQPKPSLTPTPVPTPVPGQPSMPRLLAPPSFVWDLPQLDEKSIHQRTLRRAAALMARPRQGDVLLNVEALNVLAQSLEQVSHAPSPTATITPAPDVVPQPEGEPTESPYEPTPTPAPGTAGTGQGSGRAKQLLAFFGAPVQEWANRRRDAAAYLEDAGRSLKNPRLQQAADAMRDSADALTEAANKAPEAGDVGDEMTDVTRSQFADLASAVRRAYEAEKRAAQLLSSS